MYLECRDDKLRFFEIAVIEIIDDDIGVEQYLFEETNLLRLSEREVRR